MKRTLPAHPLVNFAALLGLMLFILPAYWDFTYAALQSNHVSTQVATTLIAFGSVIAPLAMGDRLSRRRPDRWRRSRLIGIIWCVLAIAFVLTCATYLSRFGW